jgi:hypothetical protein
MDSGGADLPAARRRSCTRRDAGWPSLACRSGAWPRRSRLPGDAIAGLPLALQRRPDPPARGNRAKRARDGRFEAAAKLAEAGSPLDPAKPRAEDARAAPHRLGFETDRAQ